MTVESLTKKVSRPGNDLATSFSFSPIVIYDPDHLTVILTDSAGTDTTLNRGTGAGDYIVVVSTYPGTGSITYPATGSDTLATGETLTIKRVVPLLQEIDLENQGGYFADTQEQGLDLLTMQNLQQQDDIDRSIRVPVTDTGVLAELPSASERASKYLAFDSNGDPIAASSVDASSITVSSFVETILDDTSAVAVLQTLAPSNIVTYQNDSATEATSPNDAEYIKEINFVGPNDAAEDIIFASIKAQIAIDDDGAEVGRILFDWIDPSLIGTGFSFKLGAGPVAQLTSYSTSAAVNPKLQLFRKSTSPANGDVGGQIDFSGNHDNTITTTGPVDYANIRVQFDDVTEDSEVAHLEFIQKVAGSDVEVLSTVDGNLNVTNDIKKAGTLYPYFPSSQATTSGSTIDFTGLPSWAKRITIMFNVVSLSGTNDLLVQLGTSGGFVSSSYASSSNYLDESDADSGLVEGATSTSGFIVNMGGSATHTFTGHMILTKLSDDIWIESHTGAVRGSGTDGAMGGGASSDLGDELTQVRITVSGVNTFDAGSVNILVE